MHSKDANRMTIPVGEWVERIESNSIGRRELGRNLTTNVQRNG